MQIVTYYSLVDSSPREVMVPKDPSGPPLRWPWISALFAVLVFLDLIAITVYLWGIPEARFANLEKVVTTMATWLTTVAVAFGIKYKARRGRPVREVLEFNAVRLGIIAVTAVVWFFVTPFHGVTIATYEAASNKALPGVTISLGGKSRGATAPSTGSQATLRVTALAGRAQDLFLEKENYTSESLSVSFIDVIKFGDQPAEVRFEKARGYLRLKSTPPGAAIYLDRDSTQSLGTTPHVMSVEAGEHWVRLGAAGDHLATGWERVSVPQGDTVDHDRSLSRAVYRISIYSEPTGADCFIDDENQSSGVTPCHFTLAKGTHRIRLTKGGHQEARTQVIVDRMRTIMLTLPRTPNE